MSDRIKADLEAQLREKLHRPGLRVIAVDSIPEGHSGFTYFVTVDDGGGLSRYVLRLPPPGARIAGPADVVRQGRIMTALHVAGLPTPAIHAMSTDPVVDGRPFILMEAVDGVRIEKTATEHKRSTSLRRRSPCSSAFTRCRSTRPGSATRSRSGCRPR